MTSASEAAVDGPARKRDSWSLKHLVEDVTGRPIEELQEPGKPWHPYLQAKMASHRASAAPSVPSPVDDADDPVARFYPPLVGATGRALHGSELEHHLPTLEHHRGAELPETGARHHAPGPSRRPERIYLHYLLLHVDRLSDSAIRYLKHAVDEELAHRESPAACAPAAEPESTP